MTGWLENRNRDAAPVDGEQENGIWQENRNQDAARGTGNRRTSMLSVNGNRQKSTSLVHIVIRLQKTASGPHAMRSGDDGSVVTGEWRYAVAAAGRGFPRWA